MSKTGFDQDALVQLFADASARQGDALRQAFQQATLKALQGRELTLKSVRDKYLLTRQWQTMTLGAIGKGGLTK